MRPRYPGRVLAPGELIPAEVVELIGAQLGLHADDLVDYAAREETADDRVTRLVWLRQFELPDDLLAGVPAHR